MSLSVPRDEFVRIAREHLDVAPTGSKGGSGGGVIPIGVRLLADQLTPVLAYRRLVAADERAEPSFLFESVENGDQQGRYSVLGAHPSVEIVARAHDVRTIDRRGSTQQITSTREDDPLDAARRLTTSLSVVHAKDMPGAPLPGCMLGGWVGYASYDTMRYAEPEKLSFDSAPTDDRGLPDMHFGLYEQVVIFDHAAKLVHVVQSVIINPGDDAGEAYDRASAALRDTETKLQTHAKPLPVGEYDPGAPGTVPSSNITRADHEQMVEQAKEYIRAGDIFQVVLGQRFQRESAADPFDVYRALRVVNPSPYMVYLQCEGCILVASSPEILCRVRREEDALVVTNRPLAGTRKRGSTIEEDETLELELLADEKERSEHVMLVDLGRNDVGRVAQPGTVSLDALMQIERYSHVMHISSTVTGTLRDQADCWDALRAALPVGTISGAPKVRAMQIIDELECVRRGPYGGGMGYISFDGEMDIALALRTIVVPTALRRAGRWVYHLQSAGGIVADSQPESEYDETVNKAAAMARAIDVAERAFDR